jgi:hypothetical protein
VTGGRAFVYLVEADPVVAVVAHIGKDCHIRPYVRPARNLVAVRNSVQAGEQVFFGLGGLLRQMDSSCFVGV